MLYKPNFCCNCGEKIERVEWNLLTSRRFCPACATEHKKADYAPRTAVAAGVLVGVFGLGSLWSGSAETVPAAATAAPVGIRSSVATPNQMLSGTAQAPAEVAPSDASQRPEVPVTESKAKPKSATFFCGALTKKGTPCSRKVKGQGTRCFQHEGKPSTAQTE